jgi:hypothetical protein
MNNGSSVKPPFQGGEPTSEVKDSLLKSSMEKLTLADGDLVIVRLSTDYRRKLNHQQAQFWMKASGTALRKVLDGIGKKKVDFVFLDEGVKLEKVPLVDLKKLVAKLEAEQSQEKA